VAKIIEVELIDHGFGRELEDVGRRFPGLMRQLVHELGGETEDEAQAKAGRTYPTLSGKRARPGSRIQSGIRMYPTAPETVEVRGPEVRYFPGWEFGSKGRYRQFPTTSRQGRLLGSALAKTRRGMEHRIIEVVDEAVGRAFPG
jgi:hypothetical protein